MTASQYDGLWFHPQSGTCTVVITDNFGLSVDDTHELADTPGEIWVRTEVVATVAAPGTFIIGNAEPTFYSTDYAAKKLFEAVELPLLGGMSGARGWSSVSCFQRCRYLWKHKYGTKRERGDGAGPKALEVGSLLHLFLAVHYMQRINPLYPVGPDEVKRFFELVPVTPEFLEEAWRLYDAYRLEYRDESWLVPLAVEELVVDPRTGQSCRWDLVFRVDAPFESWLPGVYVCNHKSTSADTLASREEWRNDGQIFGEIDLYEQLGYHRKWGPLRGAVVNRIIKTKIPKFDRVPVQPPKAVLKNHRRSLRVWDAEMAMAEATGSYPPSRSACVTRYQTLCELFDHCAGGDIDAPREIEGA